MTKLEPGIELQKLLATQIFNALQGDVTEPIREECEGMGSDVHLHSIMQGTSLKVSETLLPHFYALCREVQEKLGVESKIDFYISGNGEVNACAYYSGFEAHPHVVEINSGLFNLMNDEELKFVVGHEIGHLINQDSVIGRLVNFIYPNDDEDERMPGFLDKRIKLYNQIAELGADRYGYLANENLEACLTAIYKLASGLFLEKMNVSLDMLMSENTERLEFFLNGEGVSRGSHPVNPIRIRAIQLYATANTPAGLNRGMNQLMEIIVASHFDALDDALAAFVAAAGVIIANLDGKRDKNEEEFILKHLGGLCLNPAKVLKQVEKADVHTILDRAIDRVLEIAPGMRANLLKYYIDVAFSDGVLGADEVGLINAFGQRLGFPEAAVAEAMAAKIRVDFVPKPTAIKL